MKKLTFVACAAMLASAVAFTGCKGDDQNGPDQQNVQNVATDITIALPTQVGGPAKMPSATVQTSGYTDFAVNGMKDIVLMPFAKSIEVSGTDKRLGSKIELGAITGSSTGAYTPESGSRTKVFENKPVPAGTGAFLFYAESGATATGDDANFKTGKLTASYSAANPKDYEFYLSPIQENAATVTGNVAYTGLIAYMNSVASAETGGVKWYEYANNEAGLVDLFNTYKTAKVLSSFGVARMMTDLYNTLEPLATNGNEMATAIRTAIANTTTYVDNMTSNVVTLKSDYANFPEKLLLPAGALSVAWDGTEFKGNGGVTSFSANLNPAAIDQYTYPASLWYYANSKIYTSPESEKDNYAGKATWSDILGEYPNYNATVNSTTRSIALATEIQYAVARLDIQLKAAETLADNNTNTAANQITNATGYELTGVLVGGQKSVGWDFTPETYPAGGTHNKIYTIYDKVMGATVKATVSDYSSAKNSTLVLASEVGAAKDIYIAIELLNNSGKDFYGVDHQMIPAGGKFYLVGKLNAHQGTAPDPKTTDVNADQVFKQDYTTTAKITIGDLKSAYNTIPDLKAPSVEIGFSVNLEWTAGNVYEITL